jgi:cell division protein FtsQ
MKTAATTRQPGFFDDIHWGKFAFWLITGVLLMLGVLLAWHQVEDFLIKDPRFRMAEAEEYPGQSPDLVVEGTHYASASQIRHVFAEDFGRSLYLVPIQKRRQQLLAIDWVEDATVSKIWPKTIKVHVHERVPVAFVHLRANARDGMSRFALIDADGYILRPRVAAKFTLPVITGIKEDESLSNRRARVRRVIGMLKELGGLSAQISEINVADPNNLVVEERVNDRVVTLLLGDENYAERLQNFLSNYAEIRMKRPDVTTMDLRVDGVITAVGAINSGQ